MDGLNIIILFSFLLIVVTSGDEKPMANWYNWALKKTATQSSTYNNDNATRAVDGNVTNNVMGNSCSSTDVSDFNAWWMVDLGVTLYVEEVVIVNRGDCCGNRLHSFSIEILTNLSDSSPVLCHYQDTPIVTGFTKRFKCPEGLSGQFVRIRKDVFTTAKDILTLCEVEVFGLKKVTAGEQPVTEYNTPVNKQPGVTGCPSGFTSMYGQCYGSSHFKASWLDARDHCSTTPGADLAVFSSMVEELVVSTYLKDQPHGDVFYLGAIDYNALEEKSFVCMGNKTVVFTNWAPSAEEPDCLTVNRDTNFTWHAVPCNEKHFFVCETSPY